MGTKTIGLRDDAYERLKSRKRDDESFTDLVERLLDESTTDWRDGFGALSRAEGEDLERRVEEERTRTDEGLSQRQERALDALESVGDGRDETA